MHPIYVSEVWSLAKRSENVSGSILLPNYINLVFILELLQP